MFSPIIFVPINMHTVLDLSIDNEQYTVLGIFASIWKPLTVLLPCLIVLRYATYGSKTRNPTHGMLRAFSSSCIHHYIPSQNIDKLFFPKLWWPTMVMCVQRRKEEGGEFDKLSERANHNFISWCNNYTWLNV